MVALTASWRGCILLFAAQFLAGCVNMVVPPPDPVQPVSVYLLDHGRHASLVLEHANGITRYSYGHWDYYARNRTGPLRASGTLFGNNEAGLGRRRLPGPADLGTVRRQVLVPIVGAWRIEVPVKHANELIDRLDGLFTTRAATQFFNPLYDLHFVRHPDPYSLRHNSNHVTGEWLRTLGCRVHMGGPFSVWEVEEPRPREQPR